MRSVRRQLHREVSRPDITPALYISTNGYQPTSTAIYPHSAPRHIILMRVLGLLLLLSCVLAGITENYYDIMGIQKNASEEEIRKAFKKLSLKFHPDRNLADRANAQKHYAKIATAYEVLSDPDKRRVYDRGGEAGVSEFEQQKSNQKSYEELYKSHWQQRRQVYASLYTGTDVIELEMDNISRLFRRELIWIVNFYHPTCSHCVDYKPEFISIAQKLAGIVTLAAINCSSNEELCEEYDIKSYPTLMYFPENTAAEPSIYTGNRDYNSLSDYAVSRMQSFVRLVNRDNFQEFIDLDAKKLKVLLFTMRKTTPPIIKVISKEFKDKIVIGEVRNSEKGLVNRFNVTNFPTILALTSLNDPEIYTGEAKIEQLQAWIRSFEGKTIERPLVRELTRKLQKSGHCHRQDPTLCILLFTSSPFDPAISRLHSISKLFQHDKISFFWVNSSKYREFYEGFGEVRGVIYKVKRGKFVSYKEVEELRDLVPVVLSGGGNFEKLLMEPEMKEMKEEF